MDWAADMKEKVKSPVPAWLEAAPRITVQPPIVTRVQELPFEQLLWENFERLCLRLVRLEAEIEHCQFYGERGQNQEGIDIYAKRKDTAGYWTWQCKRESNFGPAKIKSAVKKFLDGIWADKSEAIVLCTMESLVSKNRADTLEEQRSLLDPKGISLIVWDSHQLSMKLKTLPEIVADFFGGEWVKAFCGGEPLETTAPKMNVSQSQKSNKRQSARMKGDLSSSNLIQGNKNTINITNNYYSGDDQEGAETVASPSGKSAQLDSLYPQSEVDRFDGPKIAAVENLLAVLTGSLSAVWILGEGTSVRSGIPLSEGLAEKAVRWAYCLNNGRSFKDPSVRLSDYRVWLNKHYPNVPEPRSEKNRFVMRQLLQPRDNRREFLLHIINNNVPASAGYEKLVELMIQKLAMTVLTTHFDQKLPRLCRANSRLHHVDVIEGAGTYKQLTTSPRYPRLVQLYGTFEDYIDRFEDGREDRLDTALISRLIPLLRDHPLIVIGYDGMEESIIRQILIEQVEAADHYQHGIFWCVADYRGSDDLPLLARELADLIRSHFQVVPIEGFDEVMEQLWAKYQRRHPSTATTIPVQADVEDASPTYDMEPLEADFAKELDWPSLQSRIVSYCERWNLKVPQTVNREWLVEQLCGLDLAVKESDGGVRLTNAGYLLFGRKPQERLPASQVIMRVSRDGQVLQELAEGNLWTQLTRIIDTLADFNQPFLLKGEKHETVFPYPPRALHEVVVNALVHREYSSPGNVLIEIEQDRVRITNPGGLVEEVRLQTAEASLLRQIEAGKRGIKGYRNPVIADLFYGSRYMEKEGSGLADVHRLVTNNGGRVTFGPINNNAAFEVVVHSRPEAVDRQTGTAVVVKSTRYAANLLEVEELPGKVWQAPTGHARAKDMWAATDAPWLPPFITHGQQIHTFFDLDESANPLRDLVNREGIGWTSVEKFSRDKNGERNLVWLVNECLSQHLRSCGMIVDKKRKRAYFPRTESGNRSVSYQARLRRSSRTVTKQIVSQITQKVRYWEHQSLSYSFERFGDTWALHLLPGYVFTRDGYRDLLEGERVNILSTKRASRDYNSKVHTDLVFWAWVLSAGEQGGFALRMGPTTAEWEKIARSLSEKPGQLQAVRKRWNGLSAYANSAAQPRFLFRSSLPTLTVYSLEESSDEDLMDEQKRAEMAEIEEELAALAEEFEEEFDDR